MRRQTARRRRGNYAVLFGLIIMVIMGFGALGIDLSWLRLAESQAQDVADAASQAGLVVLRQTGDPVQAQQAAARVVARNQVGNGPGALLEFQVGTWVNDGFTVSSTNTNAARAVVGRELDMLLGPIFGWHSSSIQAEAISAARKLHVILVMDITNSWSQSDFNYARAAALSFYDIIIEAAGPEDRIGMVVFTGRYGVEYTPLMLVDDAEAADVRQIWANELYTASKAGTPNPTHTNGCNVWGNNNFGSGECFPTMWREYTDEAGTDHAAGLEMARVMFDKHPGDDVYRAAIILTDGNPNGISSTTHKIRFNSGYNEDRWEWLITPKSRTTQQVQNDTATLARAMFLEDDVHVWGVSFVANADWMNNVKQGDGYYVRTTSNKALVPIFEDIAESLPLAIVR